MQRIAYPGLLNGLNQDQIADLKNIHTVFRDSAFDCFLVGGSVRDLVIGRPTTDLDIATNARPEQVMKLFRRVVPTGIKHGTVTVLTRSGSFEVTTYRSESLYTDARRPDHVQFATSLEEDLSRRDFTMNALAFDLTKEVIIDAYSGLADIEKGIIRTIRSPFDRFYEDALRPVRACRFAATLQFEIEPLTKAAMNDRQIHDRARSVAIERFTDELWKAFASATPSRMLDPLQDSGLLDVFFPGRIFVLPRLTLEDYALLDNAGPATGKMSAWLARLSANSETAMAAMMKYLKFSSRQMRDCIWHQRLKQFLTAWLPKQDTFELRIFLSGLKEAFRDESLAFIQSGQLDAPVCDRFAASLNHDALLISDLAINGTDLLKIGFAGQEIGATLKRLQLLVLKDQKQNEKTNLMTMVSEAKQSRN